MRRTLYRLCIAFIYLFPISIRSADILKIKNRRTRTRHTGHKRQKRAVYTVKNRKRNIIEGLVFFKVEERDSLTLSACCGILYYILYIAIGYIYIRRGETAPAVTSHQDGATRMGRVTRVTALTYIYIFECIKNLMFDSLPQNTSTSIRRTLLLFTIDLIHTHTHIRTKKKGGGGEKGLYTLG